MILELMEPGLSSWFKDSQKTLLIYVVSQKSDGPGAGPDQLEDGLWPSQAGMMTSKGKVWG